MGCGRGSWFVFRYEVFSSCSEGVVFGFRDRVGLRGLNEVRSVRW